MGLRALKTWDDVLCVQQQDLAMCFIEKALAAKQACFGVVAYITITVVSLVQSSISCTMIGFIISLDHKVYTNSAFSLSVRSRNS